MRSSVIEVDASCRQVIDVTEEAAAFCSESGDGILQAFLPHATAGLAIMETGSGSEDDLLDALERLLPRDDRYRHHHGSVGHGADHVLPALISPSVTVPVERGRLLLGTWQRMVVVDLNGDNPRRQLRLTFLSGT